MKPSPRVSHIEVHPTEIHVILDDAPVDSRIEVSRRSPAIESPAPRPADVRVYGATLIAPRFNGGRDGIYDRWTVSVDGTPLAGPCYATDFTNLDTRDDAYPITNTIKGLQVRESMLDDAVALGVRHAGININQGDVMVPGPGPGINPFEHAGKTYYFDDAFLARYDELFRGMTEAGIVVTVILLNSPNWRRPVHEDMRALLMHPGYDKEGFISAFNVVTPEGLDAYTAFIEYIAGRYTRTDGKYGRAWGYIIGNEIDSQWVWGNAGEMPVEQYMQEYGVALRSAWAAVRKHHDGARTYVSLDHLWMTSHLDNPLRTYKSRECLELLDAQARREGNYPWALAFHPYPEDLRFPDFWNDQSATDDFDTPRITFKNIDVLARFLRQERFLYNGEQRRIILSEQGFNSNEDDESEAFQAAAYALAYEKIEACDGIDSFILHAHADNLQEFGLHLGLWRVHPETGEATSKKPVYDVFRDIDGPNRQEILAAARPFLDRKMKRQQDGEKLF